MRNAVLVAVAGVSFATAFGSAVAQSVPKSGTIAFHTGWKNTGTGMQVADKRMQGTGTVSGATFNNSGAGPLHQGPANCSFAFFAADDGFQNMGYCAFGDADGDRIFTKFTGSGKGGEASGTNEITGGTGKYAGIQGKGPWKCKDVGANGESACTQQLEYRLP